jgi:hypothetical protein
LLAFSKPDNKGALSSRLDFQMFTGHQCEKISKKTKLRIDTYAGYVYPANIVRAGTGKISEIKLKFFWYKSGEKVKILDKKEKQMKRFIIPVVIASLIGGSAFAVTNVVNSVNVVGYNQVVIPSNQFVLVALDFNTTNNTINGLFGNLPTGCEVLFWNPTAQNYQTFTKGRSGWGASGTNILAIGAGAFLKVPAATNIYMSGDVPMNGTSTLFTVSGFKILSYPYPADMAFTNTALAKGSITGDELSIWNNGWSSYTRGRSGWAGAVTNVKLQVGQALLFKANTNRPVNEVKPYTIN